MDYGVRNHWCEGLKQYQEASTISCIPKFDDYGNTEGCDDTNYVSIIYCPFCGQKLMSVEEYKTYERTETSKLNDLTNL